MKIVIWIVQVAILVQFAQGQSEFAELRLQLERFGLECVLKGNGTLGQPTSQQIVEQSAQINRGLNYCFGRLNRERLERQYEHEFEESGLERTGENERKVAYKMGCKVTSQVAECLESFEQRLKDCKHTPALAFLALTRTMCQSNGNTLYEFSQIWGQCVVNSSDREQLDTCFGGIVPDDVSDQNAYVQNNLCKVSTQWKDCLAQQVRSCDSGKYKEQVDEFLGQLKASSPEAAECFFSQ